MRSARVRPHVQGQLLVPAVMQAVVVIPRGVSVYTMHSTSTALLRSTNTVDVYTSSGSTYIYACTLLRTLP